MVNLSKNEDQKVLTYLTLWTNPDETEHLCGVLSVNFRGFPIEYRFTDKIKIDKTQKIFYGKALKSYLINEAIGSKIIDALEKQPSYILVNEEELLQFDKVVEKPVLYYDTKSDNFIGKDEHVKAFKNIPKEILDLDKKEPFERLSKAIKYSIENE